MVEPGGTCGRYVPLLRRVGTLLAMVVVLAMLVIVVPRLAPVVAVGVTPFRVGTEAEDLSPRREFLLRPVDPLDEGQRVCTPCRPREIYSDDRAHDQPRHEVGVVDLFVLVPVLGTVDPHVRLPQRREVGLGRQVRGDWKSRNGLAGTHGGPGQAVSPSADRDGGGGPQ